VLRVGPGLVCAEIAKQRVHDEGIIYDVPELPARERSYPCHLSRSVIRGQNHAGFGRNNVACGLLSRGAWMQLTSTVSSLASVIRG